MSGRTWRTTAGAPEVSSPQRLAQIAAGAQLLQGGTPPQATLGVGWRRCGGGGVVTNVSKEHAAHPKQECWSLLHPESCC